MDDINCKGCVCLTCERSNNNPKPVTCPYASCRLCTDLAYHKRSVCDKGIHEADKKASYGDFVL